MQDLAIQYFAGSLRTSRNRLIFWETDPCSVEVVDILKNRKDLQLQYHALLVVWLITFEKKIARELNKFISPGLEFVFWPEETRHHSGPCWYLKDCDKRENQSPGHWHLLRTNCWKFWLPTTCRISWRMLPRRICQPWWSKNCWTSSRPYLEENGRTKKSQKISPSFKKSSKRVSMN